MAKNRIIHTQRFFTRNSHFCAWLVFAFYCFATPSYSQGKDCVGVESDIARLQCFDAAFAGLNSDIVSPDVAISKLAELVNYSGPDVDYSLSWGENPCAIQSVLKIASGGPIKGTKWVNNIDHFAIISYNNLSFVERIGGWGGATNDGVHKYVVLFTERGHNGLTLRKWESYSVSSKKSMDHREVNESGLNEIDRYEGREARFTLLVGEFAPDQARVEAALMTAIAACRSNR